MAGDVNDFMSGQAQNQYLKNLPNYANMVGSRTENIGQQLKGQLPQDVINQIGQQAAERGIAGGSPGSPNANAAYLRALGLNSLQMQQQGSQNLSAAIADTPVSPLFSPASMMVPNYFGQQELNNARIGRMSGAQRGGGGSYITGMPAVGFSGGGGGGGFSPDAAGMNGSGVSGPSWGTGGGASSSQYTPPDWNYSPQYSPRYSGNQIDFGQFNEEDNYFSGMPNNYVEAPPTNAWQGTDYSSPDFNWFE